MCLKQHRWDVMFDGVCVVEKVRVGGGEINQRRDV